MSRSATPATRNEATTRLQPPKRTTSAELPIGTAIRGSRGRLRTVADGCDRERKVERTHPQPPDPQSETGTLATHSGKHRVIQRWSEKLMHFFGLPMGDNPSGFRSSQGPRPLRFHPPAEVEQCHFWTMYPHDCPHDIEVSQNWG